MEEGRERSKVYYQALMGGPQADVRQPTNLYEVNLVCQGPEEVPRAFLEKMIEAHKTRMPLDPEAPEICTEPDFSQPALDVCVCYKLQGLEGFEGKKLAALVAFVGKVFTNRDPRRQTRDLTKALDKWTQGLTSLGCIG